MSGATATELVFSAIAEKGRIPFAEFMEIALYAPGVGYYTAIPQPSDQGGASANRHSGEKPAPHLMRGRNPESVLSAGPPHDYYTAPHLHPVYGRYLARHIAQVWQELGEPERFDVVEMGAGRGILAWDILNGLRAEEPQCWRRTRYQLIDRGSGPNAEQQEALQAAAAHPLVMRQELAERVSGVVLSNELLDALPVHRARMRSGELQELYVTARDGRFNEEYGEVSTSELATYVERLGRPPEGWHGEICLDALTWLDGVARALIRGRVITIDYGATWAELCSARWVDGTLACYHGHRVGKNPYVRIGAQDITAHVNFSALVNRGEANGLRLRSMQSQAEYLIELGIGAELAALATRPATAESQRTKRAITDLIWPDGLGGFRVLVQEKVES